MRLLIIGLGSMGKRRIRNLQALNIEEISGFDPREDRRKEVEEKYKIKTFSSIEAALETSPEAFIISVPPDLHHIYAMIAIEKNIHFFTEASVVDTKMEEIIELLKTKNIVGAPSATSSFHPAVKKIKEIIKQNELGKISNIFYHTGQYLPDWHTYEKVSEYYVSNPATGGAREIVPFELTWITNIFGFPFSVCGHNRKTIDIEGAEKIDDTYNILLDYKDFLANIIIDVVSRHAVRRLMINGDKKQLVWDWDEKNIKIYDPGKDEWEVTTYELGKAAEGYNANIGEEHYIEEMQTFINAVKGEGDFSNTVEEDLKVLKLLYSIEESDKQKKYIEFKG